LDNGLSFVLASNIGGLCAGTTNPEPRLGVGPAGTGSLLFRNLLLLLLRNKLNVIFRYQVNLNPHELGQGILDRFHVILVV
jgi:hypothetical protein